MLTEITEVLSNTLVLEAIKEVGVIKVFVAVAQIQTAIVRAILSFFSFNLHSFGLIVSSYHTMVS